MLWFFGITLRAPVNDVVKFELPLEISFPHLCTEMCWASRSSHRLSCVERLMSVVPTSEQEEGLSFKLLLLVKALTMCVLFPRSATYRRNDKPPLIPSMMLRPHILTSRTIGALVCTPSRGKRFTTSHGMLMIWLDIITAGENVDRHHCYEHVRPGERKNLERNREDYGQTEMVENGERISVTNLVATLSWAPTMHYPFANCSHDALPICQLLAHHTLRSHAACHCHNA